MAYPFGEQQALLLVGALQACAALHYPAILGPASARADLVFVAPHAPAKHQLAAPDPTYRPRSDSRTSAACLLVGSFNDTTAGRHVLLMAFVEGLASSLTQTDQRLWGTATTRENNTAKSDSPLMV
ncbi:MAG: hypothetical protein CEE40_08800 [Chloroflexi bacterium B3_Chlor]|nr:MAG: hypothetical protein CEE40_08800 [Chloroflexi bacterium B3_Chlor]